MGLVFREKPVRAPQRDVRSSRMPLIRVQPRRASLAYHGRESGRRVSICFGWCFMLNRHHRRSVERARTDGWLLDFQKRLGEQLRAAALAGAGGAVRHTSAKARSPASRKGNLHRYENQPSHRIRSSCLAWPQRTRCVTPVQTPQDGFRTQSGIPLLRTRVATGLVVS